MTPPPETQVIGDGDLRQIAAADPKRLRVAASPIADLSPLAGSALEELELNFTFVEDLAPLLDMPSLRKLRLFGNPLSAAAYEQQVPALRARLSALEVSPRDEWEVARQVWDAGHRLAYGRTPRSPTFLLRPGRGADGQVRHVQTWSSTVLEKLASTDEELLAAGYTNPDPPPESERFLCPYITGDAAEASGWLKRANLSEQQISALKKLIRHFPKQLYYRDTEAAIARFEATKGLRLPPKLRILRLDGIAGVCPQSPALQVRFDRFDLAPPAPRHIPDHYYEIGLLGSPNEERTHIERDVCSVLPVGESADSALLESTFAVGFGEYGVDVRVYEYGGAESLFEEERRGRKPYALDHPVFDSYAAMLGHIAAFRIDGVEVTAERD